MRSPARRFAASTVLAIVTLAAGASDAQIFRSDIEAVARDHRAKHPDQIYGVVKDYPIKRAELLQDAISQLKKWREQLTAMSAADQAAAISSNAKLLFDSPRQATLGNPRGDVTLVEFLDYNCGSCKSALPDMMTLLADDPKLRIVLKEHPVLGPTSLEAARVAVAVRMQDPSGERYLAFHKKLLGERGPANQTRAMAVAQGLGLDMARLERDMTSAEVRETIEENAKLARLLGIKGTPGYVVGDAVVPGEVGVATLKEKIEAARGRALN